MEMIAGQDVFNAQAFVLGSFVLILCILIQAFFVMVVTGKGKQTLIACRKQHHGIQAQLVFIACILILLLSHLCQIYVWGLALNYSEIIPIQHKAMVYAGSTYTTVGFISDPLPTQWQLLSVIMAVSGLLSFGWSTAVMFILSQALFPAEK